MDYEEFVRGCHLGVFPSYYEPWGYTPGECGMALGFWSDLEQSWDKALAPSEAPAQWQQSVPPQRVFL